MPTQTERLIFECMDQGTHYRSSSGLSTRLCVKSSAFIVLCACLKPLLRLAVGQNMLQSGGRNWCQITHKAWTRQERCRQMAAFLTVSVFTWSTLDSLVGTFWEMKTCLHKWTKRFASETNCFSVFRLGSWSRKRGNTGAEMLCVTSASSL